MDNKHFGFAAIVAAILIPLCQVFAPIAANLFLKEKQEKLEFVKLYVEYINTTPEKQVETYSKLKLFYPKLWEEYKNYFVENTKNSDQIKEMKKSDIEISTLEISDTRLLELNGFTCLNQGQLKAARANFEQARIKYPTYHNVSEITQLLKSNLNAYESASIAEKQIILKRIYGEIISSYSWGMPSEIKNSLKSKL